MYDGLILLLLLRLYYCNPIYLFKFYVRGCDIVIGWQTLCPERGDMVRAQVTKRIYTRARQPDSLPLWPFGLDQV